MAVADMIGAAVGVILLVIVAYLLVGSVLSTSQVVTNAQKSAFLLEEKQLKTNFYISSVNYTAGNLNCSITNDGNEPISDFSHMDVIVLYNDPKQDQIYLYSTTGSPGTWTILNPMVNPIHPYELDPNDTFNIQVVLTNSDTPARIQINSANAVTTSTNIP